MHDRLIVAVDAVDPTVSLTKAVRALLSQGRQDRDAIYSELEGLRVTIQAAGRESEEDAVLEVMDFLTGWCSPHARI
ncbi:MAG: hypothetical protein ACRDJE_02505 [Dehalococcoidia bacterium]